MNIANDQGSADLCVPLQKLGVPAQLAEMAFCDAELTGEGPHGRPVLVGVELKEFTDLLTCIVDRRFADVQLPGILNTYEVRWLLVEGLFKPGPDGQLLRYSYGQWIETVVGKQKWRYTSLAKWLHDVACTGVQVWHTSTRDETLRWLHALYEFWCTTRWDEHTGLKGLHQPAVAEATQFEPVTQAQRVAAVFPGLGAKRARLAAEHFKSALCMATATPEQWLAVEGIGEATAQKVYDAWRTEK